MRRASKSNSTKRPTLHSRIHLRWTVLHLGRLVTITVSPTEQGVFDGNVQITSDLRGTQIISLRGQSVIQNRDRVRVDLDTAVGIQDRLTWNLGVNGTVDLGLHVQDLSEVSAVTIQISKDPSSVALVTNGLMAGSFVTSATLLVQSNLVSSGLVEGGMVSQFGNLGCGSGYLGKIAFRTVGGFYYQLGVSETSIEAITIRYEDNGGTATTLNVTAEVRLNFDLACWGDFDFDGEVSFADFLRVDESFNESSPALDWATGDIPLRRLDGNDDDVADIGDFVIFQSGFGNVCP